MANQEYLDILRQGAEAWNQWRKEYPDIIYPDLNDADLEIKDLRETTLREANLSGHNLNDVDFSGWDLGVVNLNETSLIKTNFSHANLSNCSIYRIAAWDIQLDEQTVQKNLIITTPDQPAITVDNLKIAQFIYLLLNNERIRYVIDTITSKVVLILGRFTDERKAVLDALKDELRKYDYLPVLFDFAPPHTRDLTETVGILARLAHFVIADLTDPHSIPHELYSLIPDLRNVPFQPLLEATKKAYPLFEAFWSYPWVLPIYRYRESNLCDFFASVIEAVIDPAEKKVDELAREKAKRLLGQ